MLDWMLAFMIGVAAAGLVALAATPFIWRRALRLTRERLAAQMPMSMAEIRAAQDHIRAAAAVERVRLERMVDMERGRRHDLMAEAGRLRLTLHRAEVQGSRAEADSLALAEARGEAQAALDAAKAELAAARVALAARDSELMEARRAADRLQGVVDALKVDTAARATRIVVLEEELAALRRDSDASRHALDELRARAVHAAADIVQRDAALLTERAARADADERLRRLEADLAERQAAIETAERRLADLTERLAAASAQLAKQDAALTEREVKLAFAAGREADLQRETERLRRLLDADNAALRQELGRIAASIARQATERLPA